MMSRYWKIALAGLAALLIAGVMTFPALVHNVLRLQHAEVTEQQARRQISQPQISTPSDVQVKAHIFWASATSPGTLEPTDVELPLSADPVQRCRQLLTTLIAKAPSEAQRTLPADTELLSFYLFPEGAAIADFSEALGTKTPSGILSEKMAVDSILDTLAANAPSISSLKILIHGQEADTLAGHIDLTGFFPLPTSLSSSTAVTDPAEPVKK